MANEPTMTIIGNLTADPELRFTQSGIPVANFTVASTPRTFDRQANEWKDGETLFMRCSIWRDAAENIAESLEKGARVIAYGRVVQRGFTDRDGNERISIEMQVDEVGPSLKYATAEPRKVDRRQGGAPSTGGYAPQNTGQGDPWAGGGFSGGYDDPPF